MATQSMAHKLLIVDDDTGLLDALATYMKGVGYEVVTANSGEAALDQALQHKFDLVLMDVRLPGLSGSETMMRLKNLQPQVEEVFFTADQDFESSMDFLRFSLPAERVLVKPIDLSSLIRLIISILGPPLHK